MNCISSIPGPPRVSRESVIERHEAKYIIPPQLVPQIREYIRPFCDADPNGVGQPPEYVITTLQLDSPGYALHHAKENEALNRFKLRVRTYGEPGHAPVFMEVKRKIRGAIIKSRTRIPFEAWCEDLIQNPRLTLRFRSEKEELGFLDFVRLSRQIGAVPAVLIRYVRESYFGRNDHYARVTFDRKLEYQPATNWTGWGRGGRWIPIDSTLSQNKQHSFSGVVLELKTLSDMPHWMLDLVMTFNLVRTGNCKYSTAVWKEALFRGTPAMPAYAIDLMTS